MTSINMLLSMTFPIDDILVPYLFGKVVGAVTDRKPYIVLLVALICILIGSQVFYIMGSWHDALFVPAMENHIRNTMLRNIIEHYETNSTEMKVGEILSRTVKIPLKCAIFFERFKNYLFPYFLSFIVTSVYIATIDVRIGLSLFIAGLLVYFLIFKSPTYCKLQSSAQDNTLADVDDMTEDVLKNITTVYSSNQVANELDNLKKLGMKYANKFLDTTRCTIKGRFYAVLCLGIMLLYFGYRTIGLLKTKQLNAGAFVAIFTIIMQWFGTLGWLSGSMRDIVMEWGMLSAHEKLLEDQGNTNIVLGNNKTLNNRDDDINVLSTVGLTYEVKNRKNPILDNVNINIRRGERVAIIGDIGSGKSTLLKLFAGLKLASSGHVLVHGHDLTSIPKSTTQRLIGYVQQHPVLFDRPIIENMTYGIDNVDENRVRTLISQLGLEKAFGNLEEGLQTKAGKGGSILSGGQRQLVQIMRIMILDPEVLLLDEVTASLDADSKKRVGDIMMMMIKNKTVVMVTHDPFLMNMATRTIKMRDGRLESN